MNPIRLFFKHAQDVFVGYYMSELKGALATANNQWPWAKFHETSRVKRRFLEEFTTAYNTLTFKDGVTASVAAVTASVAAGENPESEPQKVKKGDRQARLVEFRKEAEVAATAEIGARMVMLTQDGTHQEVTARLSSTRLYQNLTESVKFMAFYDVKNARLMERTPTETVVQREPLVDMAKFTAFCEVANGVLKNGSDFVWILAGKSEANVLKIRKKVAELGWRDKAVHLVYDWKNFQKWYVKRMRGMANSRTYEKAILCWKGKFPSGLPKDRQYVDAGSALYVDTMLKVPVLHPKDLTYVEKSVLGESLKTMGGVADEVGPEDIEEALASVADSAASVMQLHWWLTQLCHCDHSRNMSRSGACIAPPPMSLWCGSHMTITPICSRNLSGNRGALAGCCMARQHQALVLSDVWRQGSVSFLCARMHITRSTSTSPCVKELWKRCWPDRGSSRMRHCKRELWSFVPCPPPKRASRTRANRANPRQWMPRACRMTATPTPTQTRQIRKTRRKRRRIRKRRRARTRMEGKPQES